MVVIKESHNMDFITIQGLIRKLQAHEKRVNHIQVFQNTIQKRSKMALDIPKKVEDVDKVDEEEQEVDLEKEVEATSIS